MLYHLGMMLVHKVSVFHVFKYLTFRTGGATLTALLISFFMGPSLIRWLKSRQAEGQPIRQDGPESHFAKKGTPTMGGILILFALLTSTLLWVDWSNRFVWIVIACTIGFGCIGAADDYLKLTKRNSKGVSGRMKLILQGGIALIVSLLIAWNSIPSLAFHLTFPFFKEALLDLGWFYIVFSVVVVVGASNAVNLTDGLDGLAIVPIMIVAACFCLISYLVGNFVFANYLQLHFTPGAGELAVFSGALVGAGLGFLWFNAPPAMVFMGDTGSLAVGAALGAISVVTKHEIVLAITGGIFVIEAVSVMMQVGYFKLTRRRIFLMAPIHHHFEKKGWSEPTVVIRFWIISFVFALIGLSTLKLR